MEISPFDQTLVDRKATFLEGGPVPLDALSAGCEMGRTGNATDPFMTKVDQVPGRKVSSLQVVCEDGIDLKVRQFPVNQDDRDLLGMQREQGVRLISGTNKNNPIDLLFAQHLNVALFFLEISFSITEDYVVALVQCCILDCPSNFCKKRVCGGGQK